MQIELIGSSGAGKTTLAASILRACRAQGIDIELGDEFVLRQMGLGRIKNPTIRALLVNVAALSACLANVNWKSNLRLYVFAIRFVFRLPIPRRHKTYVLRNMFKKVGIGEIVQARSKGQHIVILDEGVLHIAHNLFVHVSLPIDKEAIGAFLSLVSCPDVVVYVSQSEATLIKRLMTRDHKRISERTSGSIASFVHRATEAFETVIQHPAVDERLLVVEVGEQTVYSTRKGEGSRKLSHALNIVRFGLECNAAASG